MRALVMDFAKDKKALDINDEYMFGKSILVCPVTKPMYTRISVSGKDTMNVVDFGTVKTHDVYLPKGADWYDFWTGEEHAGGVTVSKETPLDIIPLYVKAGSIIPFGPSVQYATEKRWDDLQIRIYPGADGEYTLYEDENDNYNYEKGAYSTITFTWNEAKKKLTIGDRKGLFPGMLSERKFNIVRVSKSNGTGMESVQKYDNVIQYTGKKVVVAQLMTR
jgi:alpha-D-xyloside xylohydrolase